MSSFTFKHIVVVGAGAVGSFYGAMLAKAGHQVTLVGRPAHVQAIQQSGLQLELAGSTAAQSIALQASSGLAVLQSADLVLFCVKSTDTETVAGEMAQYLPAEAVILSLQNGVENASIIASRLANQVIPAVVYVATELPAPGFVRHHGRGELVIGHSSHSNPGNDSRTLKSLVELFASASISVEISTDVMAQLWSKLLINCAYNAISALAQINYAKLAASEEIVITQTAVVNEVLAVAKADGVNLSPDQSMQAVANIAVTMASQKSSTAQDMARKKPSEIDHLNGFIVRRGRQLGVATPVNQALHALIKLVESGYPPHG